MTNDPKVDILLVICVGLTVVWLFANTLFGPFL